MTERKLHRWQIDRPAKIRLEGDEVWAGCIVSDLSFTGCMAAVTIKLPKDNFMRAEICLSDDCILDVEAWVVWHRPVDGHNVYGLYFTKITDKDKEKIYKFIQRNYPDQLHAKWGVGPKKEEKIDREEVEMEDRRIFQRFPAQLPVRFLNLTTGSEGEAQTLDVSAKGLGLTLSQELKPSSTLEMWLSIPDSGEPLYTRGEVAWSRPDAPGSFKAGINLEKADLMGLSRVLRAA
ncbi:MAG: PilZ domain-containing protein [Candidatus Omnitrophica bacterium]|nr:PilZ domain-containing protein [Candidatus Omnitrophota bacterium]